MIVNEVALSIVGPAFLAGLLVLATHVPLGREVLKRGIIFIDLAIAQVAGLGVIAAAQFGGGLHGLQVQVTAFASALIGALALGWAERRVGQHQEALIGVVFVLAAAASVLLLANNPHGGEHLQELLVGQILWVDWPQLLSLGVISAVVLTVWWSLGEHMGRTGFYILFALAVTASVQLVGVYLVFSSLIIPALASARLRTSHKTVAAYLIGASGYALGLLLSTVIDLPSGAVIVWTIATTGVLAILCFGERAPSL
jgi:zinc/manganese transport system permease protein